MERTKHSRRLFTFLGTTCKYKQNPVVTGFQDTTAKHSRETICSERILNIVSEHELLRVTLRMDVIGGYHSG